MAALADDMSDSEEEVVQLRARFVTQVPSIRVTTDPFAVPARLGRKGLTDVIAHLLGPKASKAGQTYDFLVYEQAGAKKHNAAADEEDEDEDEDEDELPDATTAASFAATDAKELTPEAMRSAPKRLLRGSLRKHMAEFGLSTERLLTVEYMPAVPRPNEFGKTPSEDWVAALGGGGAGWFVAGCYDGAVRLLDPEGGVASQATSHEGAVKVVTTWDDATVAGAFFAVTGGHDRTIRAWHAMGGGGGGGGMTPLAVGEGGTEVHENAVESLACTGGKLASGDWDGRLCMWDMATVCGGQGSDQEDEDEDGGAGAGQQASKKRRVGGGGEAADDLLKALSPSAVWKAHAQCLSGLEWLDQDATSQNHLVSASWDHSIKTWDVERQDCVATVNGSKVNTCLTYARDAKLLVTGHPDGALRLWDPRRGDEDTSGRASGSLTAGTLQAEGGSWVSDVAWCGPSSPFLVAATSHDAKLRLWDLRGNKPLYTLRAGYQPKKSKKTLDTGAVKALAAAWSGSRVGAGGSDSAVHMYELSDLA